MNIHGILVPIVTHLTKMVQWMCQHCKSWLILLLTKVWLVSLLAVQLVNTTPYHKRA